MQAHDLTTLPLGQKRKSGKIILTSTFILNPVWPGVSLIDPQWQVMALSVCFWGLWNERSMQRWARCRISSGEVSLLTWYQKDIKKEDEKRKHTFVIKTEERSAVRSGRGNANLIAGSVVSFSCQMHAVPKWLELLLLYLWEISTALPF